MNKTAQDRLVHSPESPEQLGCVPGSEHYFKSALVSARPYPETKRAGDVIFARVGHRWIVIVIVILPASHSPPLPCVRPSFLELLNTRGRGSVDEYTRHVIHHQYHVVEPRFYSGCTFPSCYCFRHHGFGG
jgi:hypothetical protein